MTSGSASGRFGQGHRKLLGRVRLPFFKSGAIFDSFRSRKPQTGRRLPVYRYAVGIVTLSAALPLAVSGLFAIGDGLRPTVVFLVAAAGATAGGMWLCRERVHAAKLSPVPALAGLTIAYLWLVFISSGVYLATGAFDRLDDALYESAVGAATSALTLLEDPAVLDDGVLVWRSATQWLGGFGALAASAALLPFLGGSREFADPRQRTARKAALASRPVQAFKRVAVIYGAVSVVVTVAFWAVGLSFRDGIIHTFSTVSTGGFSPYADSIAHFDSVAVEIVMIIAMLGAGMSLALVWMLGRGQAFEALRAYELRVFAIVLVLATGWIWWLTADSRSWFREAVDSAFSVVSLATTTGAWISDWGSWHPGAVTVLSIMLVVGGMVGSVAGGLRWIRVAGLMEFVWRELQRQLHPRSVRTVRVGRTIISEAAVDRIHAQLVFTMGAGVTGAILLTAFGSTVVEGVSLASSAVATTGPALGDGGTTIVTAADLSRPARLVLIPLMIAGRVALYPALVLAAVSVHFVTRRVTPTRVRRAMAVRRTR